MRRVVVQIDSLVLKGFRFEDRHSISAGLQEELSRLLTAPETVQQLTKVDGTTRLSAGNISVPDGTKPQQVGIAAARGIGRRLTQ